MATPEWVGARWLVVGAAPFVRRAYLKACVLNARLLHSLSKAQPKKVFSGRLKAVARLAHASLPSDLAARV
jgi:hypothetical protein